MGIENILNKYTDEKYLSLSEIKAELNVNSVDAFSDLVLNYRKRFSCTTYLFVKEGCQLEFNLTKILLNKCNCLSKILTEGNIIVDFSSCQNFLMDKILKVAEFNSIKVNKESLINSITNRNETNLNMSFLKDYYDALVNVNVLDFESLSDFIYDLNLKISQNNEYKTKEYLNNNLYLFLENFSILDSLVKYSLLIYFLLRFRIFPFFNKETVCLICSLFISNEYKILKFLDYENDYEELEDMVKQSINKSETDATFFVLDHLDYLFKKAVSFIKDNIFVAKKFPFKDSSNIDKLVKDINVLPHNVSPEVKEMMSKYPILTEKQVIFYLKHREFGKVITIQDFIEEESVCYETGRTSLDLLVKLGFYDKRKIRKKFVYICKN